MTYTEGSSEHLCSVLGIRRPVLCAPMANISGGRLASAVANAGGLAFLGAGYGDREWLERETRLVGDSRFGIGLITWNMERGTIESALAHRPSAVWLSFGDPSSYVEAIHAAGVVVVCQVGTPDEALQAASAGADVVVAQGAEAGGHGLGRFSLDDLVSKVAAAIPEIPVVAAGGINNETDLVAIRSLGAAGVALGSAFYATHEALDLDAAKQKLVDAGADDTVRSVVYDVIRGPQWPPEYSGRSIRSELTDTWAGKENELRAVAEPLIRQYRQAVTDGDVSVRVVWAGAGISAIDRVRPAAEIVNRFPQIERIDP